MSGAGDGPVQAGIGARGAAGESSMSGGRGQWGRILLPATAAKERSPSSSSSSGSSGSRVAARREAQARDGVFDFDMLDGPAAPPTPPPLPLASAPPTAESTTLLPPAPVPRSPPWVVPSMPAVPWLAARATAARTGRPTAKGAATTPLLHVCPSLARDPKCAQSIQNLVVDLGAKPVTIFMGDPPGGDPELWGPVDNLTVCACGSYYPIRVASKFGGSFDLSVQLRFSSVTGCSDAPLRVLVVGREEEGEKEEALNNAVQVFFLDAQACQARLPCPSGDLDVSISQACVVSEDGIWVMDTPCLLTGAWTTRTSLAVESDLRLHAMLGDTEATPLCAAPVPSPAPDLFVSVRVWITTLEGERNRNVERLRTALEKACSALAPPRPIVQTFMAWNTRGLNAATSQALCRERVLRRAIFMKEEVVIAVVDEENAEGPAHIHAAKVLGRALSHSDIWHQLVTGDEEGPWLIFEEDAVLNEARNVPAIITSALATFVDGKWDMLLLGAHSYGKEDRCAYVGPCVMGPVTKFFGFWGYAISKRGAARALAAVWGSESCNEPVGILRDKGLMGDIDCGCSRAAQEGRLDIAITVPHLSLHPDARPDDTAAGARPSRRRSFTPSQYEYRLHVNFDEEFWTTRTACEKRRPRPGEETADEEFILRTSSRVAAFRRAAARPQWLTTKAGEAYVVVHKRAAKRAQPSTEAECVGLAMRGQIVRGVMEEVQGIQWLRLQDYIGGASVRTDCWMLVHGGPVGLGPLLEKVRA